MLDHDQPRVFDSMPPEASKTCIRCKKTKPECAFPLRGKGRPRGTTCSDCRNENRRRKGVDRGRIETPEARLTRKIRYAYGLSREQYEALIDAQRGVCAICERPPAKGKRLAIDHCHTTGKVRALLCTSCNVAVGVYENHGQAAAKYLAAYGDGNPLLNAREATQSA